MQRALQPGEVDVVMLWALRIPRLSCSTTSDLALEWDEDWDENWGASPPQSHRCQSR